MLNIEKKILAWIEDHLILFVILAFTAAGVAVRIPLMDFVSDDSRFFLLPWYQQIRENGIGSQVGNYNLVYQMLIYLMTKLPMEPVHAYKILSIVFDYLLALAGALLVWRAVREDKLWKCIYAYGAILLSPIVFLNSAAWAQCDGIYVFFAVAALIALLRDKARLAMIMLGLSFSFKLQAVFMLPLVLFVYYRKRKFSILEFLWIPLTMCVTALPAVFFGRSPFETFSIYGNQTVEYEWMSANYPSIWLLLTAERNPAHFALMQLPAILTTVAILALLMLGWLRAKVETSGENIVFMAFLLAFTCVLFLPAMHERYSYMHEALAIVIACICPSTIPLCAALLGISMCTYGYYLFDTPTLSLVWLAILNLAVYLGYIVALTKKICTIKEQ